MLGAHFFGLRSRVATENGHDIRTLRAGLRQIITARESRAPSREAILQLDDAISARSWPNRLRRDRRAWVKVPSCCCNLRFNDRRDGADVAADLVLAKRRQAVGRCAKTAVCVRRYLAT
jgi:hypothetical protein